MNIMRNRTAFYKKKTIYKNNKLNINENNKLNINDKIDNINLDKIQKISKELYFDNVKDNIINYIKNLQNSNNINYNDWLKQFNEQDYNNELVHKIRDNKIYHKIWNDIIDYDDFQLVY